MIDIGQKARHAINEWLAADKADRRVGFRLRRQMFAAAKSDLKPIRGSVGWKQIGQAQRPFRKFNLQPGQQLLKQVFAASAQTPTMPASVKSTGRAMIRGHNLLKKA
ncbi:MAG: hypothetical protein VXX79_14075, partial [Pseudomonadota bacterium]|nr:hypothetical protein [Pseudomonadota bacterium]